MEKRRETPAERFIDMHCHIIPAVDDGASGLEETARMLRIAREEGIAHIIATPHHHPKRGSAPPEVLRKKIQLVRELAQKMDGNMKVFLASEIFFGQEIPDKLAARRIFTINGSRYVLIEFSPTDSFDYICQGIRLVQMKGYKVVLAHVERYLSVRSHMENTEYLCRMGVLLQVNAGSITGESGRVIRRFVKELLERALVFCVGTDAHNSAERAPRMRKAAQYVQRKYGREYMRQLFFDNAALMLRGQERGKK